MATQDSLMGSWTTWPCCRAGWLAIMTVVAVVDAVDPDTLVATWELHKIYYKQLKDSRQEYSFTFLTSICLAIALIPSSLPLEVPLRVAMAETSLAFPSQAFPIPLTMLTLAGGGDDNITPVELLTGTLREREMGTARPGMVTWTFCSPPRLVVRLWSPATLRPEKEDFL